MRVKLFSLLLFSLPTYAVITPDEFIDNFINDKPYEKIHKIDLLIFKNQFIDEIDLKEQWKVLEPLDLDEEFFMIKDQPTLLVEKPIFQEEIKNTFIPMRLDSTNEELINSNDEEKIETQGPEANKNLKFNLFERILFEKEFEALKIRLEKNKDYEVLYSISWYQPLVKKNHSAFILVENSTEKSRTYGKLLIYKDRYLHFDAKLRFGEKTDFRITEHSPLKTINFNEALELKSKIDDPEIDNSYWIQTIFNNIKINMGDFSKWIMNTDVNNYPIDLDTDQSLGFQYNDLYEINQEIKVEENEFHFIDHPYFGIIVRVSSLPAS